MALSSNHRRAVAELYRIATTPGVNVPEPAAQKLSKLMLSIAQLDPEFAGNVRQEGTGRRIAERVPGSLPGLASETREQQMGRRENRWAPNILPEIGRTLEDGALRPGAALDNPWAFVGKPEDSTVRQNIARAGSLVPIYGPSWFGTPEDVRRARGEEVEETPGQVAFDIARGLSTGIPTYVATLPFGGPLGAGAATAALTGGVPTGTTDADIAKGANIALSSVTAGTVTGAANVLQRRALTEAAKRVGSTVPAVTAGTRATHLESAGIARDLSQMAAGRMPVDAPVAAEASRRLARMAADKNVPLNEVAKSVRDHARMQYLKIAGIDAGAGVGQLAAQAAITGQTPSAAEIGATLAVPFAEPVGRVIQSRPATKAPVRPTPLPPSPPGSPTAPPPSGPAPAPTPAVAATGHRADVRTVGDDAPTAARYALIPVERLTASHLDNVQRGKGLERNPAYALENSRDYASESDVLQVQRNARDLDPQILTDRGATNQDGPPVVTPEGMVMGGNSRAMSIIRAFRDHPERAQAYVRHLRENAAAYGLDPNAIQDNHVLVRLVDGLDPAGQQALVPKLNVSPAKAYNPTEDARAIHRTASPEALNALADAMRSGQTLGQAVGTSGRTLLKSLVGDAIPVERLNAMVQPDGSLTELGGDLLRRVVGLSVGDDAWLPLLDHPNTAQIANATTPALVRLRRTVEAGHLPDRGFQQSFQTALDALAATTVDRKARTATEDVFALQKLQGDPVAAALYEAMKPAVIDPQSHGKNIRRLLSGYRGEDGEWKPGLIDDIIEYRADPAQGDFLGGGETLSPEQYAGAVERFAQAARKAVENPDADAAYMPEFRDDPDFDVETARAEGIITPEYEALAQKGGPLQDTSDLVGTPERQALHHQIAEQLYGDDADYNHDRQAFIVIGPPGAGKSTLIGEPGGKSGLLHDFKALLVDSDEAKKLIPEYHDGANTGGVHEESSIIIRNELLPKALKNGTNFAYPRVGSSPVELLAEITAFKNAGYQVHTILVDVDSRTSVKRANDRGVKTGRYIDPDYIIDANPRPRASYQQAKAVSDSFARIINQDGYEGARFQEGTGLSAEITRRLDREEAKRHAQELGGHTARDHRSAPAERDASGEAGRLGGAEAEAGSGPQGVQDAPGGTQPDTGPAYRLRHRDLLERERTRQDQLRRDATRAVEDARAELGTGPSPRPDIQFRLKRLAEQTREATARVTEALPHLTPETLRPALVKAGLSENAADLVIQRVLRLTPESPTVAADRAHLAVALLEDQPRTPGGQPIRGAYSRAKNTITLYAKALADPDGAHTALHELNHALETVLSPEQQLVVESHYLKDLKRELDQRKRQLEALKRDGDTPRENLKAAQAEVEFLQKAFAGTARLEDVPSEALYRFLDRSEYFAHRMTDFDGRLLAGRENTGPLARIAQFARNLLADLKDLITPDQMRRLWKQAQNADQSALTPGAQRLLRDRPWLNDEESFNDFFDAARRDDEAFLFGATPTRPQTIAAKDLDHIEKVHPHMAQDRMTWRERMEQSIADFRQRGRNRIVQTLLNRFDPIRRLAESAYRLWTLLQNTEGTLGYILDRGQIEWDPATNLPRVKAGTEGRGINWALEPVKGIEFSDGKRSVSGGDAVFYYMEGVRARDNVAAGREVPQSAEQITSLLEFGQNADIRDAATRLDEINNNILDFAQAAGLIDPKARKNWVDTLYVPFHKELDRILDKGDSISTALESLNTGGPFNQRSGIHRMGGKEGPIANPQENWAKMMQHLIAASHKNMAAREVTSALYHNQALLGTNLIETVKPSVQSHKTSTGETVLHVDPKGPSNQQETVVSILKDGKQEYHRILDPDLYQAVNSFGPKRWGTLMQLLIKPAAALRKGIVSSPPFVLANAMRDGFNAWVVSGEAVNPWDGLANFMKVWRKDPEVLEMITAGASAGGYYNPVRDFSGSVRKAGAKNKSILRRMLNPLEIMDFFERIGETTETATRFSVYKAAKKRGAGREEAAFNALDLINYRMQGSSETLGFFLDTIPFLRARISGNYKMGRAAVDHRAQGKNFLANPFWQRGLMLTAGTLALQYLNSQIAPEKYDELEEWDKDANWHIFIPDSDAHFRIPKPFEVGALFGTVPERIFGANGVLNPSSPDYQDWKLARDRAIAMLAGTFELNPVPQAAKPVVEQWANKSFFTGRPIVPGGMEDLDPSQQYDHRTRLTARAIASAVPDLDSEILQGLRSPKRIESLLRGYFGTMATYGMAMTDLLLNPIYGDQVRQDDILDLTTKRFIETEPRTGDTRYLTRYYEALNEASQYLATLNHMKNTGRIEQAKKYAEANRDKLRTAQMLRKVQRHLADINRRTKQVANDQRMTAEQRQAALVELERRRSDTAKTALQRVNRGQEDAAAAQ